MGEGATNVLVLGGGFAGVMSAKRIARDARDAVNVTLVSKSDAFVERVRFHEVAASRDVKRWPIEPLVGSVGVKFVHAEATAIDLDAREVKVVDRRGTTRALPYDRLVYALGSAIDLDAVPGVREHTESVTDEDAARRLASRLGALPEGARVVIVGGGMTGIECATEIAEARPWLRVKVVSLEAPCEPLSDGARQHLARVLDRMKVEVRTGARVRAVDAGVVHIEHEPSAPFDVCIWAASFKVPALAKDAGLDVHADSLGRGGQLKVDEMLRSTSHPEVYGAGDAALPTPSVKIRMGCATAMPMATHAADNLVAEILEKTPTPFRFAYLARFISLGRSEAIGQFTHADDSPRSSYVTGLVACWLKEGTFWFNAFALENGFYPWKLSLPRGV